MGALGLVLVKNFTIQIGNNIWSFGTSFIVYLVIAAIIGIIAEFLVGWRLPFGVVGAVVAALIGIWLMTKVIIISGFNDIDVYGVPLIKALIGAVILVAIWHLVTYPAYRGRRRYYYRGR